MIYHGYCNCDDQQPEEIRRHMFRCKTCGQDISPDDFSEAPDLVVDDNFDYEDNREQMQVEYGGGRL